MKIFATFSPVESEVKTILPLPVYEKLGFD
jgi:hypothetical protein